MSQPLKPPSLPIKFKSCKRYLNLVAGHFPFFFHAICFRVITFAFLFIYLGTKAFIPIFLIWLSNICIGYATVTKYKIPPKVLRSLKRIQLLSIKRSDMSELNGIVIMKKSNESIPVWLNVWTKWTTLSGFPTKESFC